MAALTYVGTWRNNRRYQASDVVDVDGTFYICQPDASGTLLEDTAPADSSSWSALGDGGASSGPVPGWGKFADTDATGSPNIVALYDAAAPDWVNAPEGVTGVSLQRDDYHGSREQIIRFYGANADFPSDESVYFSIQTVASSVDADEFNLANLNTAVVDTTGELYASMGTSAQIYPSGSGRNASMVVVTDLAPYPYSGIGMTDTTTQLTLLKTPSQTDPLVLFIDEDAETPLFQVAATGSLGVFGVTPPAQSGHGTTAAHALACLIAFGFMAAS